MKNISINRFVFLSAFLFLSIIGCGKTRAQMNDGERNSRGTKISLPWIAAQLLPSPQWRSDGDEASFGFQWQVTPLLFSYGINKKVSPWSFFVVNPVARQSGSFEFYFSPEYFKGAEKFKDRWIFSYGTRIYFPLWQKGEYLSASVGVSYFNFNGRNGVAYEAGFYLFAGFVGFQTGYSPEFVESKWRFTIRLRAF